MLTALRVILLIVATLCFLAALGSKTEKRGYLDLIGGALATFFFLISFNFAG